MELAVAVCAGHRCAALLPPEGALWEELRSAVRASPQALLVSAACPGACAQGPVVAVAGEVQVRRSPADARVRVGLGQVTWLGPVSTAEVRALCRWLRRPGTVLPADLAGAVLTAGPGAPSPAAGA